MHLAPTPTQKTLQRTSLLTLGRLAATAVGGLALGVAGSALATPERPPAPEPPGPPLELPEAPHAGGPPFELPPGLGLGASGFEEVPPFQGPPEGVPPEPETPVGPEGMHPLGGDVPPPRFERLLRPQQVPEPATLAVLGVGLSGLALFGSRRRGRPGAARG